MTERKTLSTAEFIRNGLLEAARKIREERQKDLVDPLSRTQSRKELVLQLLGHAMDPDEMSVEDVKWLVRAMQCLLWSRDAGLAVIKGIETAEEMREWDLDEQAAIRREIETEEENPEGDTDGDAEQEAGAIDADRNAENRTGRGTSASRPDSGNIQRGGTVPAAGCDLVPDVLSRGSTEVEGCGQQPDGRSGTAGGDGAGEAGQRRVICTPCEKKQNYVAWKEMTDFPDETGLYYAWCPGIKDEDTQEYGTVEPLVFLKDEKTISGEQVQNRWLTIRGFRVNLRKYQAWGNVTPPDAPFSAITKEEAEDIGRTVFGELLKGSDAAYLAENWTPLYLETSDGHWHGTAYLHTQQCGTFQQTAEGTLPEVITQLEKAGAETLRKYGVFQW